MASQAPVRATDPRPARTRAAIYAAVEHLSRQPAEEISVNSLARLAGVSRQSFYNQFTSISDLAIQMVKDMLREIATEDEALPATVSPRERTEHALRKSLSHFDAHRSFYRALLDWDISTGVIETIIQADALLGRKLIQENPGLPDDCNVDDLALYTSAGGMALVVAWLREHEPVPLETMIQRLLALYPPWLVDPRPVGADGRADG